MATISNVASGELITSAWGNSVANELNSNAVKKSGTAQSMSVGLTSTGGIVGASLTASAGNVVASAGSVTAPAGSVLAGVTPSDVAIGTMIRNDGVILSTVNDPSPLGTANAVLQRTGVSSGVGGFYMKFNRLAGGATIGSITIVAGPGVAYNTTSDRRLKDIVGDVGDALGRLRNLIPRRLRWRYEPESGDFDGFIADEVQAVVPTAVTGESDALDDEGRIAPQQLDQSRLVPLLVAAVQELAARVEQLEAAT